MEQLLEWMSDAGLNQSGLARRLGVRPQDITNWKYRGLPSDQYVNAADAFGRSVDELLGRRGPVAASPESVAEAIELIRRALLALRPRKRSAAAELLADICDKPDSSQDTTTELTAILSRTTQHKSERASTAKRVSNG